jgi:hypothetical protein
VESTRGILAPSASGHPILRGIRDRAIWVPTDVYRVRLPLPAGSEPLVLGEILQGMRESDAPAKGQRNDPMMPVAWTRTGLRRVFTTTMGSAEDLLNEGFRRLLVNAVYWALEMEDRIDPRASVDLVGAYDPLPFKFDGFARGVKPSDLEIHE